MEEKENNEEKKSNLAELVERGEKVSKDMAEMLKKQEELAAKKLIEGDTDSGEQKKEEPKESPRDYAKRIMGGA